MKAGSLGKLKPAPTEPLAETSVVAEVAKLDCLERTARATLARHFEGHGSTTTFFEITSDLLGQEFSAAAVTVALGRLVKKGNYILKSPKVKNPLDKCLGLVGHYIYQ